MTGFNCKQTNNNNSNNNNTLANDLNKFYCRFDKHDFNENISAILKSLENVNCFIQYIVLIITIAILMV